MAKYKIIVSATAEKSLKRVPKKDLPRLINAIQVLAVDPRPPGCRKLSFEENVYRIRQGRYRIIYEVDGKEILIRVMKIGHRKDIYRR